MDDPQDIPQQARTRSSLALTRRQVAAIDAFNEARRAAEDVAASRGGSREARLDTSRRLDVLRRQHAALVERTHSDLLQGSTTTGARALVAHRNAWFRDRVAQALEGHGLSVVGLLDCGADVVGAAAAEQPDLVLLEDPLPMMTTEQVVRETLRWSPGTFLAVQSLDSRGAAALQAAGVRSVFSRAVPPADVAAALACALRAPADPLRTTGPRDGAAEPASA